MCLVSPEAGFDARRGGAVTGGTGNSQRVLCGRDRLGEAPLPRIAESQHIERHRLTAAGPLDRTFGQRDRAIDVPDRWVAGIRTDARHLDHQLRIVGLGLQSAFEMDDGLGILPLHREDLTKHSIRIDVGLIRGDGLLQMDHRLIDIALRGQHRSESRACDRVTGIQLDRPAKLRLGRIHLSALREHRAVSDARPRVVRVLCNRACPELLLARVGDIP